MTSPEHTSEPVDSMGAPIDASEHAHGFEGLTVGSLFGLVVGSGAPPIETSVPAPFPDADQFPLTKPINADQFTDELSSAVQRTVAISINGVNWDQTQTISDINPAVLWVTPSGLDPTTVETVLANHTPVEVYNTTKLNQDFSAALTKIQANNQVTLSAEELNTVVIGLALNYLQGQTTTTVPSFTPSGGNA